MVNPSDILLRLLRIALGNAESLDCMLTDEDWQCVYDEACRHCVVGVVMEALGHLSREMKPSPEQMALWAGMTEVLAQSNTRLNECCEMLTGKLRHDGYRCWILKGQSVTRYYPNPLRRHAGDIDVWVQPKEHTLPLSKARRTLVEMVRKVTGKHKEVTYHHTDFDVFDDVCVELHFTPSWMCSPIHNAKFQHWFREQAERMSQPYTDGEFDVVYILNHIFRHVFDGGVGLRQVIDYYYVVTAYEGDRQCLARLLKEFGMLHFAEGMMWMMGKALGLTREKMLVNPDERIGRWLLEEILLAGNFGHEDLRGNLLPSSRIGRFVYRMKQTTSRMRYFPVEGFCDVPWRVLHYLWRRKNGYL